MWQTWLLTIVSVLLVPTLALLWKITRGLAIFREYPPHRHVGKDILYPRGMKPEDPEQMEKSAARAGAT
jgi:hypothetical protein